MAERQAHELAIEQIKVNQEEAKHVSIFIAGWRPFIGWTCGVALSLSLYHSAIAYIRLCCNWSTSRVPTFDMGSLMTVLMGMLGLGSLKEHLRSSKASANKALR